MPQLDNLDVDVTVEDNLAGLRAALPGQGRRRRGRPRRSTWRGCATAAATRSTSSRAACAGGCCWPAACVHEPKLVLLDEPTVGLDPQIRTELWTLIDDLRNRGTTILMSTHYIEEAERLADEVAVMARGQDHHPRPAGRADRRARRPRDGRGLRAARAAGRGRAPSAEAEGLRGAPGRARRSRSSAPRPPPNGVVPEDAVRRAATLEDVFVLLTGEEAE